MIGNNVYWIRNDLRLRDNTALHHAIDYCLKHNEKLTLIFHINTEQLKEGVYSNDYFFSALNVFYRKIKDMGSDILFLYGSPKDAFTDFIYKYKNVNRVFFNASERGYGLKRDREVYLILKNNGIEVERFLDKHLHSANEVLNGAGKNYKVFTPYYNKWMSLNKSSVLAFDSQGFSKVINSDFVCDNKDKFVSVLNNRWTHFDSVCGEELAIEKLNEFVKNEISNYEVSRDIPILDSTSRMSKHLSAGEISIRTIYSRVIEMEDTLGKETYIKELAWRDFYNMIYSINPKQQYEEIIEKYRDVKWLRDKYLLNIWKLGLTGYPIVDAAMRQLKETGFMHNRLRMIAASFLVKDLLIDWRMGEQYFSEMLTDYDSASNIGGWQWVASTGTDACPYFRVFNPTNQSKRYDKEGDFIKKYLPELRQVPKKYIHEPSKYEVEMSDYYPKPIVIHKEQRLKVLDMYSNFVDYKYYDFNTKNEYIKRLLLYELNKLKQSSIKELMEFHARNKYLYFAYDQSIKDKLGRVIATNTDYQETFINYKCQLFELLDKQPNKGNYINAYQHIYGYFKKIANYEERENFAILLRDYEKNVLGVEVINRFLLDLARKYNMNYIMKQSILRT